jgi:hypothetical protein
MPGHQLRLYGSTGPGGESGDPQPDRALWLGRNRSSDRLDVLSSTLTAGQGLGTRHRLVDAARIGESGHVLRWVAMHTGPAAGACARVEAFEPLTGTFVLDRALPASAASGNRYALYAAGNCFPTVSAPQAQAGETRYRCLVLRNEHGSGVAGVRVHLVPLSGAGARVDRLHQVAAESPWIERVTDQIDVLNALGQRDPMIPDPEEFEGDQADGFEGSGGWTSPLSRALADVEAETLANGAELAIWLRRIVPPRSLFRRSVAVGVFVTTSTTGSDPSPLASVGVLVWDVEAAAPDVQLRTDRYLHVGGGARVRARVTIGDEPVPGRFVRFEHLGEGILHLPSGEVSQDYVRTDARGEAHVTLAAADAEAGDLAELAARVGAGEEVGRP